MSEQTLRNRDLSSRAHLHMVSETRFLASPAGLNIPRHIYDAMISHCKRECPHEACGILSGQGLQVEAIYEMDNVDPTPVSYMMRPEQQFIVMKDMREKGVSLIAIYHSHPVSPAHPSVRDVDLAFYEDAAYVIVGLSGTETDVRAYVIRSKRIQEIGITIG